MQIAMSKTRERFPLSTKKVLKKTVAGTLVPIAIVLFICFNTIISALSSSPSSDAKEFLGVLTIIILSLAAVVIVATYLYQQWYYATYFYDLTSDYIIIKKGPITPKEITIPYERVQDVYVDQDILDRIFGIYDVHLSSATFSSGMAAHIDGVEKADADGLREVLLKAVSERISRNRVSANSAPAQSMPPIPPQS